MEVPMIRVVLLVLFLFPGLVRPAFADGLPGYDRFDLEAAHRARPVAASIWYPALSPTYRVPIGDTPIFEATPVFVAPGVAPGRHPLVLLSHGSGGSADTLGWLSAGLVARGAMVLAVNHPGSTTGDSSPRRSTDLAARARDLGAALDALLADPDFGPAIDRDRISVVGFSLGGSTALALAGLRFDGAAQDRHCAEAPKAADCVFYRRSAVSFAADPGYAADARDGRISRAVAIDPGFVVSITADSPRAVSIPVHLINLGEDDRFPAVDVGPGGTNLVGHLPGASYSVFAPASHFTFLAPCKPEARDRLRADGDDPICDDPAGADRAQVHGRLIADIATALGL
jgi:predicted dienelactone hydrolase